MLKQSCSFPNFQNIERDEVLTFVGSIRVLVVDGKKDFLAYVADFLHSCSFQVTCVDHSGAALKLLSKKENNFDLLLIASDISDVDIQTFLRLTKHMELLSVVMSEQEDDAFLLEAFKSGAFLVIRRPITIDVVMHIRQHVIRERMHKHEQCGNQNMICSAATQEIAVQENRSSSSKMKDRGEPRKHVSRSYSDDNQVFQSSNNDDDSIKKKICMEWTQELHDKFLKAISELGEGRCYPKEILERMGVPGLTRMQVASHLQKCRNERWKSNEKRKMPSSSRNNTLSRNASPQGICQRKFGCMPHLQTDLNDQEDSNTLTDINMSINGRLTDVNHQNNITARGSPMISGSVRQTFGQHTKYATSGSGITPFKPYNIITEEINRCQRFGSTITKSTHNFFEQANSSIHGAEQGSNHHANARQASDDFFDFLKDMDGNSSVGNRVLNWPTANLDSVTENFSVDYNEVIPNKDAKMRKKHI